MIHPDFNQICLCKNLIAVQNHFFIASWSDKKMTQMPSFPKDSNAAMDLFLSIEKVVAFLGEP